MHMIIKAADVVVCVILLIGCFKAEIIAKRIFRTDEPTEEQRLKIKLVVLTLSVLMLILTFAFDN